MENILSAAVEILGQAVRVERHRDWAIFWCPFHNDASRAGEGGHPNFGVNLVNGYWKCLRCGATGGSLNALRIRLGQDWKPPVSELVGTTAPMHPHKPPSQVKMLDEAMSEARSIVQRSPAWSYLAQRGVLPYTALVYGLGYGIPIPRVHREIIEAATQSLMVRRDGTWSWAGGVVYADPPTQPTVMNVRYIPQEQLSKGTRRFKPEKNHKTWGVRMQPLGSWRITQVTRTLIVLEGLFDMLITAQKIHQLGREADTVAVYTNGASPAARMHLANLETLEEHLRIAQQEELAALDPKVEELSAVKAMIIQTEADALEIGQALRRACGLVAKSLEQNMNEVNRKYDALCQRRETLQSELGVTRLTDNAIQELVEFAQDVFVGIENADFQTKRHNLEMLKVQVEINQGHFTINCLAGQITGEIRKLPIATKAGIVPDLHSQDKAPHECRFLLNIHPLVE